MEDQPPKEEPAAAAAAEEAEPAAAVAEEEEGAVVVAEKAEATTSGGDNSDEFPTFFSDEKGNLKVVNLVVHRPCTIFFSIIAVCILINMWLFASFARNGQPFTVDQVSFDVDDVRSIQFDSFRLAQDEVSERYRESKEEDDGALAKPIQSEIFEFIYWVFEGETDDVFGSAESINAMKETYDLYMDDPDYDKFCVLNYRDAKPDSSDLECTLPVTPLTAYFSSSWDSEMAGAIIESLKDDEFVETFNALSQCYALQLFCDQIAPDAYAPQDIQKVIQLFANVTAVTESWDMKGELVEDFGQVTELMAYLMRLDILRGGLVFGYDKNFSVENPKSKYSRGVFAWGAPLDLDGELDGNITINEEQDADSKREEDNQLFKEYILENFFDDMREMADPGTNESLNSYYFGGFLLFDELLKIVQIDAMLAIASLTFVFFWLRMNTGSFFLAGVGIFEIFCSIPIAWFFYSSVFQIKYFGFLNTLTIFIVAAIGADDIFIFMDAYKQSKFRDPDNLQSMETRMSWVYRRTGTAMAITSATTCAAFLCTLITPIVDIRAFGIFAALVILMDYVLVMTLFCTAVVIYHDRYEDKKLCCGCCGPCGISDPSPTVAAREALEAGTVDEKDDKVSSFFRTKFASFILSPKNRYAIFLTYAIWIAVGIWQTTQLEPVQETEQFLDENNPLQKSFSIINSEFPTAEEDPSTSIYYAWGLGLVDRTGVNVMLDPTSTGKPTYLESFDFNEQCQTKLAEACTKLRSDASYAPFIKRKDGVGSTLCFIEELATFSVKGTLVDNCDYAQKQLWANETWQIPPEDLADVMEEFLEQQSCVDQTVTVANTYSLEIGWDGESMKYAGISVESEGLDPFSTNSQEYTRSKYDGFISIKEELDAIASDHCAGISVMTDLDQKFIFMNNQKIYVTTAYQSAIVGVAIAFLVLLLATRVFHIALFASLIITSVLISVVGLMVILGWSLGSIESILIAVIAGFSVDYVVHLAHSYEAAEDAKTTNERVEAAFGDMGISVMNGMITSIAASIPLFFCQLSFFAKFGTFLCATIAFSWVFANFVFMSALAQFQIPIKHGKGFHW